MKAMAVSGGRMGGVRLMTRVSSAAVLLVLAAGSVVLTGCKAVGPEYVEPKTVAPEAWASPMPAWMTAAPDGGADGAGLARWWTQWGGGDATLASLVTRALESNLDLRLAMERLTEARVARGLVAAGDKPTVDANGGYSRSAPSETTGQTPKGDFGEGRDLFQIGLDARWELDVWGRTRRAVEAADADIAQATWLMRDVRVMIAAEVARNYVELRTAQQRVAIARQNVESQQQTLDLTENRLRAGLTSELDVTRARSQLATTRAAIPDFEAQIRTSAYALSVLTGQVPGALVEELTAGPMDAKRAIPALPMGDVSAGAGGGGGKLVLAVPTEVVRQRADVRAAERAIASATARIGVATAELYPSFGLSGAIGLATKNLGEMFDGNSRVWSIAPGVSWNVLDFGRIRANIGVQEARAAQALTAYEASVLGALREVDTAIVQVQSGQQRTAILGEAVAAQQRAVDLATKLYREGLADFISVLDTQRQLFLLQDQAVASEGGTALSMVQLYKALGGGWEESQAVTNPGQ
ncbi:MAG: efflux transporter outer membrane subunit [Phycisphaerales bacterium]|nr:efflux transporter outer membrane subunit [Phycisphaerales bacterium]